MHQDPFIRVFGIPAKLQHRTSVRHEINRALAAIHRVIALAFGEMAHRDNRAVISLGQPPEFIEHRPDFVLTEHVHACAEHGNDGIDDEEVDLLTLKRDFESPDAVLIEAMIPKVSGFEVCQDIKKTRRGRQIPVILMTSVYKTRKYRDEAIHTYGADEYIELPMDDAQLVALIHRTLPQQAEDSPVVEAGP